MDDMLDEAERHQVLVEWVGSPSVCPERKVVSSWFEAVAARHPASPAVIDGDRRLTYAELEAAANRLARRLRSRGIGPEDRVGLCLQRGQELVVAMLGTLKAGGACVCLDPEDPEERLALILADSGARVVLARSRGSLPLPDGTPVLFLDEELAGGAGEEDGPALPFPGDPGNLAFVFYTTGSTGRPKGVMITHAGRCDRLAWELDAYGWALGAGVLLKTPVSFARLVKETFWPLLSGGWAIVVPPGGHRDPEVLGRLVRQEQARLAIFVPSQIGMLLDAESFAPAAAPLHLLLSEGEPLTAELRDRCAERLPARLWNAYGLTEVSTVAVWTGGSAGPRRLIPGGRPAGLRLHLLDEEMQPVPAGVPGEIYVGGPGIARGYLGQPDQTAARWVPDPFVDLPGERLFRSGDLALWLSDGALAILGRNDDQTKLGGFRVEPAEIEAALAAHPEVRQAVAQVREDAPGDRRLVAYAVPRQPPGPSEEALRRFLAAHLPAPLVPSRCVVLEDLPLTPNGKVDRRRLPPPPSLRPDLPAAWEAPRDPVERRLAALWERLLGVQPVGVRDDFFALGGTSLLAARLAAEIRGELGFQLPLSVLLETPTLEGLAAFLQNRATTSAWSPLVCLVRASGRRRPFFCVHGLFGNVLCFRDLARCLGSDQPFYALQSQALDDSQVPLSRVEEMAACYLREVRSVQPAGPYLLGGYSFGGMVAFEMAQQLVAAGEEVSLLALLDAAAPDLHRAVPPFTYTIYVRAVLPGPGGAPQARTRALDRSIGDGLDGNACSWNLREHVDDPDGRFLRVERATREATRAYRPVAYPGRIDLVRAADRRTRLDLEPWAGWGRLAEGGLTVHDVPGDHVTLLSPPWVESLAAVLRARLDAPDETPTRPEAPR